MKSLQLQKLRPVIAGLNAISAVLLGTAVDPPVALASGTRFPAAPGEPPSSACAGVFLFCATIKWGTTQAQRESLGEGLNYPLNLLRVSPQLIDAKRYTNVARRRKRFGTKSQKLRTFQLRRHTVEKSPGAHEDFGVPHCGGMGCAYSFSRVTV